MGDVELVRTPVSELSIDELETRLLANREVQSALLADDLAIIGELEARNAHHADGHRFMGDWLTMKLNVSHETGARLATVARRLRDLPVLAAAHGEGRITFDQLHLLTRIATADSEGTLLVEYEHAPVATIALAARRPRAAGDTNAANHIGLYDRRDGSGGTIRGQYDNPTTGRRSSRRSNGRRSASSTSASTPSTPHPPASGPASPRRC